MYIPLNVSLRDAFLFAFLYLIITEEGAGHSLAGLGSGRLSLIAFWIRLHCRCEEILQVEESFFLGIQLRAKKKKQP